MIYKSNKPNLETTTNQAYNSRAIAVEQNNPFLEANLIVYDNIVNYLRNIGTKVSAFYQDNVDLFNEIGSNVMLHGHRGKNKGSKNRNKYNNSKRHKVKGRVKIKEKRKKK